MWRKQRQLSRIQSRVSAETVMPALLPGLWLKNQGQERKTLPKTPWAVWGTCRGSGVGVGVISRVKLSPLS